MKPILTLDNYKELLNAYSKVELVHTLSVVVDVYLNFTMSEEFIRKFKDNLVWYRISKFQTLSEDLIREFKDKVDWDYISC